MQAQSGILDKLASAVRHVPLPYSAALAAAHSLECMAQPVHARPHTRTRMRTARGRLAVAPDVWSIAASSGSTTCSLRSWRVHAGAQHGRALQRAHHAMRTACGYRTAARAMASARFTRSTLDAACTCSVNRELSLACAARAARATRCSAARRARRTPRSHPHDACAWQQHGALLLH